MKDVHPLRLSVIILVIGILFSIPKKGFAKWWDKFGEPKYGNTITVRVRALNPNFDPWYAGPFAGPLQQYEGLFWEDWTLDRKKWSFSGSYVPDKYYVGCLAKSWKFQDSTTMVINLKHGICWQNKEPVNGRELTAHDVEYHYDRMLGTGSGFTKGSTWWMRFAGFIEKVTAIDDYTVKVKFKRPSAFNLTHILSPGQVSWIAPRESVEISKDHFITDYKYAAGTGAWEVTDFIPDTSVTYKKNPNYWGYDERHPKNKLPYADELKIMLIKDIATALAAVRTGKIDSMTEVDWQQAKSLAKTNPELMQAELPFMGATLDFRCDRAPFNDIRVRKALQMAIDRETIAKTHYGGYVDGKPAGLISPMYKEWSVPYDKWPAKLRKEYSYNPKEAKKFLAEAGYPNGFKTNVVAPLFADMGLLQIIKAQFSDIGVDMEIKTMDPAAFPAFVMSGKQDQMTYSEKTGVTFEPWISLDYRWRIPTNYSYNADKTYSSMITDLENTTKKPEALAIKADMYAISQHWGLQVCPIVNYTIYQPYLKGYSGESYLLRSYQNYARWWIDK